MGILIKGMDEIPEDGAVLVVKHDNGKAYIKHACTYGYSMELVKLPAVQPDHNADVSKKVEGDCINRQMAIEALARMMPRSYTPDGSHPRDEEIFGAQEIYVDCIEAIEILPSAQPTLCGYNIEHLILIANVLRKENLPPERVVEALTDIGRIVSIVKEVIK